ncbi:hypothetical protein [Nodularia sphaerocarpa]|uniref:hypothetical protein n=1 Tax=Nodularia sphaerocarpa TaxID=137816 RepID=UPI001EFA508A|nr:hypothetical protein [Nodularia sphaerocarpa]MDB9374687.1 hypothetical protein [Nodularia sphaerocarpa CS-585]MDB9378855.1 hypothetical protein [Nodularia sphaerocarpa CS-585A2]
MESASINSTITGAESVAVSREDRGRGHLSGQLTSVRDTTPGKILERLEALEAQHLEYVHSHQARLKARLGESEQAENEFKRESNQIKSDIYHLASASRETNGNGHTKN